MQMKKILLTIIALLLALGLMSCELNIDSFFDSIGNSLGEKNESSSSEKEEDEDEDEEEEEDEEDENEDESSSSQSPIPAPTQPDRTVYSNTIAENGKWVYGKNELSAPVFTNFYHGYSSALTMTFDDGYDIGTGTFVTSVFKKYGFRGTAMLGPCFLNDSLIEQWNDVVEEGYLDVGCHGYQHLNPLEIDSSAYEHEIKDAIEFLREKFPSQRVLTFATPYAHINDPYEEYLKQYAISNRLEAEGKTIKIGQENNLYRVRSISVFSDSNPTSFSQSITSALKQNGAWIVELLHCVKDGASGRDATKEFFSAHCQYLYENHRNTTWIASFEDVSIYLKQLEDAKINYLASDRESMSISVTHSLDKSIYNIPMTIKLQVPSNVTTAYAVMNGKEYTLDVVRGSGVNAITVKDIPVNSDEPIKIYFGGNEDFANGCDHYYKLLETVAPTCKAHGYTTYKCAFCNVTYKADFVGLKDHDFSGERVTDEEATADSEGLDYIVCKNCDTRKEFVTVYTNVATEANSTTTDGVNEWVYVEDIYDGDESSSWTNGTGPAEIINSFTESEIEYVEIRFEVYAPQKMIFYTYDGAEWKQIDEWDSTADTSADAIKVKRYEINEKIKGIRFVFEGTSKGCTKVYEISAYGTTDK